MLRIATKIPRQPAWTAVVRGQRHLSTIGIRREDPARIWERRAPLTPADLASLLAGKEGAIRAEVESCRRRCFSDDLYREAGASIVSTLSPSVDLVLGIKEPPVPLVHALQEAQPGKKRSYMVFSHTHKGQPYNVPLLSAFLDPRKSQTLLDYELLTAPAGDGSGDFKRVAAFGWFAGAVGAGEALSMTGLALLRRGFATPLLHLPRPYTFTSLESYTSGLRTVGDLMRSMPTSASEPVVIGLTGAGNVSTGAKEMLDAFGVKWVDASELRDLRDSGQIPSAAILIRKDGGAYDRPAYRSNPGQFKSVFSTKIAPHLTTLINGAGWQEGFPRMMTNEDISVLAGSGKQKLVAIQDVACDLKGGLEFIDRHTSIDQTFFEGPGRILISSTDILPTELPQDASTYFSSRILPYVRHLVTSDDQTSEVSETIQRATIVRDGTIHRSHEWLLPSVDKWRASQGQATSTKTSTGRASQPRNDASTTPSSDVSDIRHGKKRVLLLGSGLVAGPAVGVFGSRKDVILGIGSNNLPEAQALSSRYDNTEAFALDVSDETALGEAVAQADVIMSLLPAPMHVRVAKQCLTHGKHLVTASYISPEMKALDIEAKSRDVVFLGECGLDPGIDSMAAMRIMDRVKREKKRVTSFISWCGGLPEVKASNVPLGYKFSWSPKAVLTAALNDAQFKLDGKVQQIPGNQLLQHHFPKVDLWDGLPLEGLANRDALPYAEKYGLGDVNGLTNLFRGTLRYQGFSGLLDSFRQIGLFDSSYAIGPCTTWSDFSLRCLSRTIGYQGQLRSKDVAVALRDLLGVEKANGAMEAFEWLSMLPGPLGEEESLPNGLDTPIDILAHILSRKLAYAPGERDTCLLHHAFEVVPDNLKYPGGSCEPLASTNSSLPPVPTQKITASLLHYGSAEASSMSTTVGKTLAFAALRVLDGDVKARGVIGPYEREVWEGVLDRLEEVGVTVKEEWE